jgi:hypothetical protein
LRRCPTRLTVEQAATFGVAGLTALRALRRSGPLLGARVLVTGASGGVGTFAVQLAAAGGAEVTALTGTHRDVDLAALGAHQVVTSLDDADGEFDLVLESIEGRGAGRRAATDRAARPPRPARHVLPRGRRDHDLVVPGARAPDRPPVLGVPLGRARGRGPRHTRPPDRRRAPATCRRLERTVGTPAQAMLALRERRVAGKAVLRVEGGG